MHPFWWMYTLTGLVAWHGNEPVWQAAEHIEEGGAGKRVRIICVCSMLHIEFCSVRFSPHLCMISQSALKVSHFVHVHVHMHMHYLVVVP